MRQDFRIVGSGGQGVILLSMILANAYGLHEGLEVAQTQSYGPEARGGACQAGLVISDTAIDYVKVDKVSYFVAFNEVGFQKYIGTVSPDTVLFADTTLIPRDLLARYSNRTWAIDATAIAERAFKPFVANLVMLGCMTARLEGLRLSSVEAAVREAVPEKLLELNLAALRAGFERGEAALGLL